MRSRLGNNGGNMKVYSSENLNILHPTVLMHATSKMYFVTASDIRKNEGVFERLMWNFF